MRNDVKAHETCQVNSKLITRHTDKMTASPSRLSSEHIWSLYYVIDTTLSETLAVRSTF